MKVLVACEESQAVTKELRRLGHEAYSCDIQPCSGGHPEWHLQVDALELLKLKWDMIIAHPPCTYLSNLGAANLKRNGVINQERMAKAIEAKEFFMKFLKADCPRICVENPVPQKIHGLPPYTQIIQPYMFGHPWKKKTCIWLKGLPPLFATELVEPTDCWVKTTHKGRPYLYANCENKGHRSAKMRSKTFPGIARAMAEQWAGDAREAQDEHSPA